MLGSALHRYVITTVEIESYMFGRIIKIPSYLLAIALTFGFSFLVNLLMHFKLKKIDMVESLIKTASVDNFPGKNQKSG